MSVFKKSDIAVQSMTNNENRPSESKQQQNERKSLKFSEDLIRQSDEGMLQKEALVNLDKMVQSIHSSDIPGMCLPMSNSRSDGCIQNICR